MNRFANFFHDKTGKKNEKEMGNIGGSLRKREVLSGILGDKGGGA